MPDVTRTFIAVDIPAVLEPKLKRLQQDLGYDLPGARWVERVGFHITLAFLGDVPHADLTTVCRGVAQAVEGIASFDLGLAGVGVFPNPQRPRVIWTGVAGPGVATLETIQASVASTLAGLGYPSDSHSFHPHVTLARIESPRGRGRGRDRAPAPAPDAAGEPDLTRLLNRRQNWMAGPFRVDEVITYSSSLTREGPVYAALARARLGPRKRPDPSAANPEAFDP